MLELLTPRQMALADQRTIDAGVPGIELMETAGAFLADVARKHFSEASRILVVCGPGNNGGDGYVLARLLAEEKLAVDVFIPLATDNIDGDAKIAFERLPKYVQKIDDPDWSSYELIVDALFGAGLTKKISGKLSNIVSHINNSPADVLAVDLPSGINGETGAICGNAVVSDVTATFFRFKPGHLLQPGRSHCGATEVGQIGIQDNVLAEIGIDTFHNTPELWELHLPKHQSSHHKYSRGHTLALSGPITKSGAARLMASAALRIGSGLVTLASSSDVLAIQAVRLDSVMFTEVNYVEELRQLLEERSLGCVCLGPDMPSDEKTRMFVGETLKTDKDIVLDAGALSAFDDFQNSLANQISHHKGDVVITPHSGELARLFPELDNSPSKLEMARLAASTTGAIVVLKGPDTVVANVDGQTAIASNAPRWLETAGSGDVLTGMIAGLLAQGMQAFSAACAAVWILNEAANMIGPGMVASDLDYGIKETIKSHALFENVQQSL
jgi:hydroxyethylthiazole kinase-like uncharacterized protein yjeF